MTHDEHHRKALKSRRTLEAAIWGMATHTDHFTRSHLWRLVEQALEDAESAGYHTGWQTGRHTTEEEAG